MDSHADLHGKINLYTIIIQKNTDIIYKSYLNTKIHKTSGAERLSVMTGEGNRLLRICFMYIFTVQGNAYRIQKDAVIWLVDD